MHYLDNELTNLFSSSLKLHAKCRNSKQQFYSLWFDLTGTQTYDLPDWDSNLRSTWLGLKPTIYLTGTQTYDLPDWDSNLRSTALTKNYTMHRLVNLDIPYICCIESKKIGSSCSHANVCKIMFRYLTSTTFSPLHIFIKNW